MLLHEGKTAKSPILPLTYIPSPVKSCDDLDSGIKITKTCHFAMTCSSRLVTLVHRTSCKTKCILLTWFTPKQFVVSIKWVPIHRKSRESMDNVQGVQGLNGLLPWTQSTVWTMSWDTLEKVQWVHGQSPVRPAGMDKVQGVHGQSPVRPAGMDKVQGVHRQSPRPQWTVWTLSMDTLEKVQGVQADWTMSRDKDQGVHGLTGLCPWTHWTLYRNRCNSDMVKKLEVKVASLEFFIHILVSKNF